MLSAGGLAGIKYNESGTQEHTTSYRDVAGVWTICDGHTKTAKPNMTVSREHCAWLLQQDTKDAQAAVKRLVKVPISQNQYDALVDFVFNKGSGNFASSTLLRQLNAGNCKAAAAQFPEWVYARNKKTGKLEVWGGLVKRAAWQRGLFEPDCP